jgi:fibronectin type 3 domain-containing protein
VSTAEVAPEALADLQAAQKSRTFFRAAGLSLQFYEAYCLLRSHRSILRRDVAKYFEQGKAERPPDVHPDLLEKLLLIRNQAGPIVTKLRRYTAGSVTSPTLPELHEMAMSVLLSTAPGRELAVTWLSEPERFEQAARAELKRIAEIVEAYHASQPGAAAPTPAPATAATPPAPAAPEPAPAPAPPPPVAAPAAAVEPAKAEAPPAPPAAAAPPIPPPETPEGLQVAGQRGQASLVWSRAKGAKTYTVKRSSDPAGPFETVAEGISGCEHVDRTVSEGKTYYYTVLAVADGQQSAPCSAFPVEVPIPPPAPGGLEARAEAGRVELRWIPAKDALRYRVKRTAATGGASTTVGECFTESYQDITVEKDKAYGYAVSALNDAGESPDSMVVQVRTPAPPPAPAGLTAQPLNGQVTLSWEAVPGAERYTVKRALKRDGRGVAIASGIAAPPYTDATVSNGTAYFYSVAAVNAAGEGADSAAVEAVPIDPPRPPVGLSAVQTRNVVTLSWSPAKQATSYTVKRGSARGGPYTTVASRLTQPSYKDDHVSPGTTYYYVVHSVHGKLGGPRSAEVHVEVLAVPAAPAGLEVVPGSGVLTLRWTPIPGASGYQVKRSESVSGPFKKIAESKGASFEDRDVLPGIDYRYSVLAHNAAGDGPESAPLAGRLQSIPSAPKELKAVAGNGRISLTWSAAPGATGYHVQRSSGVGGSFSILASIGAVTSFTDNDARNGVLHEYRLLPINDGGEGPASNIALATPLAPPPAPTGLEGSPGDGKVLLTWGAAKGAASYVVKRASGDGPPAVVGSTHERTYTDATVTNGTTYRYVVAAINGGGESPGSAELRVTPVDPPALPVGLVAKAGNRRVSIVWFATPGATSYGIKRATSPDGPYITVGKPTEPSYEDTGVENQTKYYYVVNAFNPAGRSANSDRVEVTPTA